VRESESRRESARRYSAVGSNLKCACAWSDKEGKTGAGGQRTKTVNLQKSCRFFPDPLSSTMVREGKGSGSVQLIGFYHET
jgi:hypothetical protein